MKDTYVDGEKMARNGCKIAKRKSCLLFKFPVFRFVSTRKNLFQYFKANDTMNQVTKTHIICGHQEIAMDCADTSLIECKKEETDSGGISISNQDICDALDLLEDKGLRAPLGWTSHIYSSPEKLGM